MPQFSHDERATLAALEAALEARGFQRWDFTLDRIKGLLELLGDPQKSFRSIHITGTNGKTSTARFIDQLLVSHGLKTGRFTSPHLNNVTERISLNGEPVSPDIMADTFYQVAPLADMIDNKFNETLTYFDMTVALAMAIFADAPIDVGVIEVGLGGETDSTNVLGAEVAVITPIGLDHTKFLGDTFESIATMKAGIIHKGSTLVTSNQEPSAMGPLVKRVHDMDANLITEGRSFSVVERGTAVGGQVVTIETTAARYENLFLPVHGAHQAHNAALALAAVEVLLGAGEPKALDGEVVEEAFAQFSSPGRLEIVRNAPTVILDAAHNPAGMATTVTAFQEEFNFNRVVGVVGMLADKDVEYMLELLEPILEEVIITKSSSSRAMPAGKLAAVAEDIFGAERVRLIPHLPDAVTAAISNSGESDDPYEAGSGVLITGSVFTVADARNLLVRDWATSRSETEGGRDITARNDIASRSDIADYLETEIQ